MKTILVIGGAQQHCKLVEAAKRFGFRTIVVDNLEDSPAKSIADESAFIDIFDIPALAALAKREHVDGVVAGWLDPCQVPYFELCKELNLPHYGSEVAFEVMTNKERFKRYCIEHDVGTIPYVCGTPSELRSDDAMDRLGPALFVKPVDSRGSRGQFVCTTDEEMNHALDLAARESSDGRVIVEKYMDNADDISITYFFVDGEPTIERFSDRLLGLKEDGLSNVCIGTISPSVHFDRYLQEMNENVVKMFKSLGIVNGPVFMQGYVDDEGFYFYDPGLRFPGGDYERAISQIMGVDLAAELVKLSVGESLSNLDSDLAKLNGAVEVIHDISLRPGKIETISGIGALLDAEGVFSVNLRYAEGDTIPEDENVSRRFAEINFAAANLAEALGLSRTIQSSVCVQNAAGDMKISSFADAFSRWVENNASATFRGSTS